MNSLQHRRPLWLGALFASLAPPLCVLAVLFVSRVGNPSISDMLSTSAVIFAAAFPVSIVTMLVIGLPYVLWLRSHNALSVLTVCAGAMAAGAAALGLLNWGINWDHQAPELLQLLYGAGLGLSAGIAFCIGAGPNNSFKPNTHRGGNLPR